MSTQATGAEAPDTTVAAHVVVDSSDSKQPAAASKATGLHSPPDSNNAMNLDGSDSELSDLDEVADKLNGKLPAHHQPPPTSDTPVVVPSSAAPSATVDPKPEPQPEIEMTTAEPTDTQQNGDTEAADEDIGDVLPDHWSGTVPVFKPEMRQFKDFKRFMEKVDQYGMKSGIIKIIPPAEWKDAQPRLDELVKQVRVREPIKQEIMGSNGTYRQVNILHQRSYNLPQWRQLCDQSEHQPPARRGERRANAEKPKPAPRPTRATAAAASGTAAKAPPAKKKRGRPPTRAAAKAAKEDEEAEDRPMTPVSPAPEKEEVVESVEQDPGVKEEECEEDDAPVVRRMGFARQSKPKTQSTSARRKYIRREGSARIDEEAFRDWDYTMDVSDYTPERCEELERIYWKTLTYAPPLYGADLPGTLFDENQELWNLNKLPNLLDVLGTKVPGVNTAYLYLGMWKATFAWHLEDVDLYSINYLHFGAPKQWYSISQADARRFEAAMRNLWPTEAKACDQFLRHKAFLISPAHLKQQYNITVNKCVSYPGEFVVTYPYGYHSGYNLGYNCAEAVNFALDSWLPMGKIAKKCQCAEAQDSVWVDVYEIERKLRGEETEYEETEDDEDDDEDDDDNDTGLPSPPSSHTVRPKVPGKKRKRAANDQGDKTKVKKVRLRIKTAVEPPCCLCPNDIPGATILSTDDGRKAHRMCALYLPETYIETVDDVEIIANVAGINKDRMGMKCLYCRSKKGACFQCSQKKCPRPYHATCAAAAGVFVEEAEVPVIGEDGTEYKEQAFEFSCRFHRTKRDRKQEGELLENNAAIREAAVALKKHDICQIQYFRGDIFAGVVLENRVDEEMFLLQVIPNGDQVEVEWKWLLLPDPADFRLPKASANAIPMPTSRKAQKELNAKRPVDDLPRKDDEFGPGYIWAEFCLGDPIKNPEQVKVDLFKENQIWHYIYKGSTDTKAQYTEDISRPFHNPKSNFLESVPKPPPKPKVVSMVPPPRRAIPASQFPVPLKVSPVPLPGTVAGLHKAHAYKPRKSMESSFSSQYTTQAFVPTAPHAASPMLPQMHAPQMQAVQFSRPSLPPAQVHRQPTLQPRPGPPQLPQLQRQPPGQHQPGPLPQGPSQQGLHRPIPRPQTSLQVKQYKPSAKDPQQKKPAASFSDRFAPVGGSNGFPQLPGLTWPPAHMNPGKYPQPHPRDWTPTDAPGTRPPPVPMTSSVIKSAVSGHSQTGGPGTQPEACASKYSFFQVYNNRDPACYRTPYDPNGGFTNEYDGTHQAFLKRARRALSGDKTPGKPTLPSIQALQPRLVETAPSYRGSPIAAYSSPGYGALVGFDSPNPGYISPYSRILPRPTSNSPHLTHSHLNLDDFRFSPAPSYSHLAGPPTPGTSSFDFRQGSLPLHPANRQQLAGPSWDTGSQTGDSLWTLGPQSPASGASSRPSSQHSNLPKPQSFTKQSHSPIPLPSYVKQAVPPISGPPKPSPLSHPPQSALSSHPPSGAATPIRPGTMENAHQQIHPPGSSHGATYDSQHTFGPPPPVITNEATHHFDSHSAYAAPSGDHGYPPPPAAPSGDHGYPPPPPAPSGDHGYPPPPAYQWTSGYDEPAPAREASATADHQHLQYMHHYPEPVANHGWPPAVVHAPQEGPPVYGTDAGAPADSSGMIQRMMQNLKKATQLGGRDRGSLE